MATTLIGVVYKERRVCPWEFLRIRSFLHLMSVDYSLNNINWDGFQKAKCLHAPYPRNQHTDLFKVKEKQIKTRNIAE